MENYTTVSSENPLCSSEEVSHTTITQNSLWQNITTHDLPDYDLHVISSLAYPTSIRLPNNSLLINQFIPLNQAEKKKKKTDSTKTDSTEAYGTQTKEKQKPGRKKFSDKLKEEELIIQSSPIRRVHSKITKDNVRRKIKVQFTHFVINFFNIYIKVHWKGVQKYKFRTIDNALTKDISIRTNCNLNRMTLREYLSQPVSLKFKCHSDQNSRITQRISKEKPMIFEPLLEMTIINFYEYIYRGNPQVIREKYMLNTEAKGKAIDNKNKLVFFDEYLVTLNDDEDYMNVFSDVGSNYFLFYQNQTPRKSRAKKYEILNN